MRRYNGIVIGTALALSTALVGCAGSGAPAASTRSTPAGIVVAGEKAAPGPSDDYASAVLPASYENAAPASTQLAPASCGWRYATGGGAGAAKMLLPLWQAFGAAPLGTRPSITVRKQIEAR
jgi:hypothetical protein